MTFIGTTRALRLNITIAMKRAGLLTKRITILEPQSVKNAYGELVQKYVEKYHTRARVFDQSGDRTQENGEIYYAYNKTFQVRSYVPVNDIDLVSYNGKKYRITSIEDRTEEENDKLIYGEQVNE